MQILRGVYIPAGALLLGVGLIGTVGVVAFNFDGKLALPWDRQFWSCLGVALAITTLGTFAGTIGLYNLAEKPQQSVDSESLDATRYRYYLVGIGYALLLLAILNLVALAGIAYAGLLPTLVDPSSGGAAQDASTQNRATCVLLLSSASMAILGALFFVANSLQEDRKASQPFDESEFWGGLWYRLGESVLFTFVFFFVLQQFVEGDNAASRLPLLALLLGMFVKAGERLVFGIAKRVFEAAQSLLPLQPGDLDGIQAPGMVEGVSATVAGALATLKWTTPTDRGKPTKYRVERRPIAGGDWETAAIVAEPVATLPYGEETSDFRVVAINAGGESSPSVSVRPT